MGIRRYLSERGTRSEQTEDLEDPYKPLYRAITLMTESAITFVSPYRGDWVPNRDEAEQTLRLVSDWFGQVLDTEHGRKQFDFLYDVIVLEKV